MKTKHLAILLVLLGTGLVSCLEDQAQVIRQHFSEEDYQVISQTLDIPQVPVSYQPVSPNHFGGNHFNGSNKINSNAAVLGRVLFYDKKLSKSETVSCASCHIQEHGFSDKVAFSKGFDGKLTERNSLALNVNVSGSTYEDMGIGFFWDERSFSVSEQSLETIQNPIEMGMHMDDLIERLKAEDYYQILFEKAFPTQEISSETVTAALSNFVNAIANLDSKFDQGVNENHGNSFADFSNFSVEENLGKALFNENCSSCHGDNVFPGQRVSNNGLDVEYTDKGVGKQTNNSFDNGLFKVPSLRNIAVTGPYMHDGRFNTLEEVVEHYSSGIKPHPNLGFTLRNQTNNNSVNARQLNFTNQEKQNLIVFLKTLTDETLLKDKRFSDPFK